MNEKRIIFYLVALAAVLLVVAGLNVEWMLWQRRAAHRAAEDLFECTELAADIQALRKQPTVASSEAMGVQELGVRIEAAMRKAQFDPGALEGVFPQAARRVGDSPYLQKPTALDLSGASLGRLAGFLYHLTDDPGLTVRDLRLRTPHGETAGDLWDAEATLTYLIYSPASNPRRGE